MRTILAFGDSLTWGSDPQTGARHPHRYRWPEALRAELGDGHEVITDAVRGRTTAFDESFADCDRNGVKALPTALYAHAPIDLVVIMLGGNDMKPFVSGSAIASAQGGMKRLAEIALGHQQGMPGGKSAKLVIVAPPPLVATDHVDFAAIFEGGAAESRKLAGLYERLAGELGCAFFDAGSVAQASPVDGIHLDARNTRAIGVALAPLVRSVLAS
ncbi:MULTISPECIES: SGNH/GDSL hydrolase family protein [unclassified Roseitalea]|uniref:SGNH/GDSL hydrolase family protein n=1 Tax=unclassified Roseitalea TaxID=2639107 RepID=UPI00273EABF4|nr:MULTISPECIES: SGNH/GDSL hydrolase family protein [unclassified Roseitalea]